MIQRILQSRSKRDDFDSFEVQRCRSVRCAAPSERMAALNLMFDHPVGEAQTRLQKWATALMKRNRDAFDGLLVSGPQQAPHATIWLFPLPGRQINVWSPKFSEELDAVDRFDFLRQVSSWLDTLPADMSWATIPVQETSIISDVQVMGLVDVTDLARMVWKCCTPQTSEPSEPLTYVAYSHEKHQHRLARILKLTEVGSLDCVGLNGLREPEDLLMGHWMRDSLRPSDWSLITYQGEDVGCLLMSRHTSRSEYEVVYVSVLPEMRGRGFGRQVIEQAQQIGFRAGVKEIVLTCDIQNLPAWKLYESCAFRATGRWKLLARSINHSESA